MAKYTKQKNTVSEGTKEDAMKVAKSTQRPGQTKEQTKLIAQGIQKGIDQYKKQYKSKARELDKKIKKVDTAQSQSGNNESHPEESTTAVKTCKLPWALLVASWIGFAAYIYMN